MNSLKTNFLNVEMKNPLMTSSGCFGFGLEYKDYFDPNELGAIVLKGLTSEPRDGNPGIRIAETPSGMLNCVGLENPGYEVFKNRVIPTLKANNITTPLVVNINGKTIDEYVQLAKQIREIKEISMVELNISCPNVKDGGMAFGANPVVAGEVTKKVKEILFDIPLIVKLSPNVTNITEIAKIVEYNGADAVSLINTLLGMSVDIKSRKPLLGNLFGGLSGGAVKPVALRMIYQVYESVDIPIVGMGGISSVNDALEFLMVGASCISIGTGLFINPVLPLEIIAGLNKYCETHNLNNINEIVGIAHNN